VTDYRCKACLSRDPSHSCVFKGVPGRDPDVPLGPPTPRTPDSELMSREELLVDPVVGLEMRLLGLDVPESPLWEQLAEMAWSMPPGERDALLQVLVAVELEEGGKGGKEG